MVKKGKYTSDYPIIDVAVDIVVFTIVEEQLKVLLIERGLKPYGWALPGGFIHYDEDLDEAARRELVEETNIGEEAGELEQLGSYGHPGRDERKRVISIAYWTIAPDLPAPAGGTDAKHAELVSVEKVLNGEIKLAFDHEQILKDAVERARSKLEYTTTATRFCAKEFTLSDLRHVYETVWGTKLDPGNFQRKVNKVDGFVVDLEKKTDSAVRSGRPATLFGPGKGAVLDPPLSREKPKL